MDKNFIFRDAKSKKVLNEIADAVPSGTEVYLFGGAIRNVLYLQQFRKKLPQRDYDFIVIGDWKKFIDSLKKAGFKKGKKPRVAGKFTLKKPLKEKPKLFKDYFWMDMVLRENIEAGDLIKERANFTVNSFAVPIGSIFKKDWQKDIISVPNALADLKKKKLRTWVIHPIDLYAMIRFVSLGFSAPAEPEIKKIIESAKNMERWRFDRDTKKVINYVGSKEKVERIAKKIGIKFNILDYRSVKNSN